MSLNDALAIAMSGLRANQAAISLVSSNVANAETPGYVRKTVDQVTSYAGAHGSNVVVAGINRELDQYVQAQLRTFCSNCKASMEIRVQSERWRAHLTTSRQRCRRSIPALTASRPE